MPPKHIKSTRGLPPPPPSLRPTTQPLTECAPNDPPMTPATPRRSIFDRLPASPSASPFDAITNLHQGFLQNIINEEYLPFSAIFRQSHEPQVVHYKPNHNNNELLIRALSLAVAKHKRDDFVPRLLTDIYVQESLNHDRKNYITILSLIFSEKQNDAVTALRKSVLSYTRNPEFIKLFEQAQLHFKLFKMAGPELDKAQAEAFELLEQSYQREFATLLSLKRVDEHPRLKEINEPPPKQISAPISLPPIEDEDHFNKRTTLTGLGILCRQYMDYAYSNRNQDALLKKKYSFIQTLFEIAVTNEGTPSEKIRKFELELHKEEHKGLLKTHRDPIFFRFFSAVWEIILLMSKQLMRSPCQKKYSGFFPPAHSAVLEADLEAQISPFFNKS